MAHVPLKEIINYSNHEDYENELISLFFSNAELIASTNTDKFIDLMFEYIKRNDEIYRMLCKSNDFVMIMQKFMRLAANKLPVKCKFVSKAQQAAMMCGSMISWAIPAARPDRYDENGKLKPRDQQRGNKER